MGSILSQLNPIYALTVCRRNISFQIIPSQLRKGLSTGTIISSLSTTAVHVFLNTLRVQSVLSILS